MCVRCCCVTTQPDFASAILVLCRLENVGHFVCVCVIWGKHAECVCVRVCASHLV